MDNEKSLLSPTLRLTSLGPDISCNILTRRCNNAICWMIFSAYSLKIQNDSAKNVAHVFQEHLLFKLGLRVDVVLV